MTDAEATGSRRERCALAAAFLLSETTQDAAVAASALVALQLFGGYEESLFIVIVMTMLLIGIQLSHVVGRRGWTLVLGGAAVCGAAGLAMMGAALSPRFGPRNAGALALAGSVLLGAHRAAHMLYRFAALEIGGVACMGEVFAAATLGGLLGPQLLIDLGLQKGLVWAAVAQLVAVMPIMLATRGRDAATAADRATAEDSGRSIAAALRKLRDAARGDALLRLALICGVTSWAIMLLVTVPAAAIAVASFKMTTCAAIRALQVQSQRLIKYRVDAIDATPARLVDFHTGARFSDERAGPGYGCRRRAVRPARRNSFGAFDLRRGRGRPMGLRQRRRAVSCGDGGRSRRAASPAGLLRPRRRAGPRLELHVARVDFCSGCSRPCINQIVATRPRRLDGVPLGGSHRSIQCTRLTG
jgi:hypothetical protein